MKEEQLIEEIKKLKTLYDSDPRYGSSFCGIDFLNFIKMSMGVDYQINKQKHKIERKENK